jgi:hypothetical protein
VRAHPILVHLVRTYLTDVHLVRTYSTDVVARNHPTNVVVRNHPTNVISLGLLRKISLSKEMFSSRKISMFVEISD